MGVHRMNSVLAITREIVIAAAPTEGYKPALVLVAHGVVLGGRAHELSSM